MLEFAGILRLQIPAQARLAIPLYVLVLLVIQGQNVNLLLVQIHALMMEYVQLRDVYAHQDLLEHHAQLLMLVQMDVLMEEYVHLRDVYVHQTLVEAIVKLNSVVQIHATMEEYAHRMDVYVDQVIAELIVQH